MDGPRVLYRCPCTGSAGPAGAQIGPPEPQPQSSDGEPEISPVPPLNLPAQQRLGTLQTWPIERLYYCDDCSEARCARCVVEEPAGFHCPTCLFDVPTASVRSEKNCCARNCFQCPVCTHVLSVVEGESSKERDGRPCFTLACSVCCWDSREIGWEFEKATGISAQIERIKASDASSKEYASLLDYWRSVQRASSAAASSGGLDRHGSFKYRLAAAGISENASKVDSLPPYTAASYASTDHERVAELMAVEDADALPDLGTVSRQEPQRVRLHMKLSRRCRECHHILIKPESKAQATRFKIQLMAANFLPTITLPTSLVAPRSRRPAAAPEHLPVGPLVVGSDTSLVLRFTNPLYTEMDVTVVAGTTDCAHVNVLTPRFTLPPFTELWEYDDDDDDYEDAAQVGSGRTPDAGEGIVHRQGNRVAIKLGLTPHTQTHQLTIPLHVKCTHLDDMADMDASDASASSRRVVTNDFWVYIALGPV
ncbi:hypothetical protein GGF46_000733 [Coemansia sp. RSA 552]|nr:hypothetical protein GGF46_000733 [Coemansia sp. RSA 552]